MKLINKIKKCKISNIVLVAAIVNILWFTITAIILQFVTQVELSSTLIACWYTFWTSEIFAIMGIKISKVKNSTTTEEEDSYEDIN